MRIYFVGSHSVGKTTLCRHVANKFKLPMLPETARTVLTRWERSLEDIRRDQAALDRFQMEVFEEQRKAESPSASFVSDRALDFLAYAAAHTTVTERLNCAARLYVETLKDMDALMFFVRPHRKLVVGDGFRASSDLRWEEVLRIDAMIEYLLEANGLRYFPVVGKLLRDRIRLVDNVIELAMRPPIDKDCGEGKHRWAKTAGTTDERSCLRCGKTTYTPDGDK